VISSLISSKTERGTLSALDFGNLCFEPKRVFYVKDVPRLTERGNHAHYKTQQYLICLEGKIEVNLFDGFKKTKHLLEKNEMIFVDRLIWDSQIYMTGKDILLSVSSTEYDPSDYITDIEKFKKLKGA
tara:strand:- start:2812 stop:3195 length:384 start_codon:yes stop_codon:yes gene_type:complete